MVRRPLRDGERQVCRRRQISARPSAGIISAARPSHESTTGRVQGLLSQIAMRDGSCACATSRQADPCPSRPAQRTERLHRAHQGPLEFSPDSCRCSARVRLKLSDPLPAHHVTIGPTGTVVCHDLPRSGLSVRSPDRPRPRRRPPPRVRRTYTSNGPRPHRRTPARPTWAALARLFHQVFSNRRASSDFSLTNR